METELCLMVVLSEVHWDASSAGPDLHVFYSDGKSEQTWTLSAGFLKPAFWVNTWRSGLADLQLQCLSIDSIAIPLLTNSETAALSDGCKIFYWSKLGEKSCWTQCFLTD